MLLQIRRKKSSLKECWIDEEDSIKRIRKICAYYKRMNTQKNCNTLLWILYSLLEKEGFKIDESRWKLQYL